MQNLDTLSWLLVPQISGDLEALNYNLCSQPIETVADSKSLCFTSLSLFSRENGYLF